MKLLIWGFEIVLVVAIALALTWVFSFANSPHKDQSRVPVQVDDDYLEAMQRAMRQ